MLEGVLKGLGGQQAALAFVRRARDAVEAGLAAAADGAADAAAEAAADAAADGAAGVGVAEPLQAATTIAATAISDPTRVRIMK